MRYATYRYNTETCKYERVSIKAGDVVWYVLGVAVTASIILICILLVHDRVVNTQNEKKLRKENQALKDHHVLLSQQLNELQPVMTSLQNKDRVLHERIFGVFTPSETVSPLISKEAVLLAEASAFKIQISSIRQRVGELLSRSIGVSRWYGNALTLETEDLDLVRAWPSLQPVAPWQTDMVISGFGLRINPFHKGLYEHAGVDIAMPRGTAVIATGQGVVSQLKRSDLEAGYGNYIEIDHGHGLVTRYAHLEEINVKFGAKVKKGEIIGTIGSSGGSVAPHLHYEIIREGRNVDPVLYMVDGLTSTEHDHLMKISHRQNQSLD